MSLDDYISIVEKQESVLCFPHFTRKDAWQLGQLMSSRIIEENLSLAASIRLSSGFVLFQYAAEGTAINNEKWITRKFNLVRDMEQNSLLFAMRLKKNNQTFESRGLDPMYYAASGGGFPIRVSGMGVIGAVIVSGLPHIADHNFVVESLSQFLEISDIPKLPLDTKI